MPGRMQFFVKLYNSILDVYIAFVSFDGDLARVGSQIGHYDISIAQRVRKLADDLVLETHFMA